MLTDENIKVLRGFRNRLKGTNIMVGFVEAEMPDVGKVNLIRFTKDRKTVYITTPPEGQKWSQDINRVVARIKKGLG